MACLHKFSFILLNFPYGWVFLFNWISICSSISHSCILYTQLWKGHGEFIITNMEIQRQNRLEMRFVFVIYSKSFSGKSASSFNLQRRYQQLEVLQTLYNCCFCFWYIPSLKWCVMNIAVFSIFGAVKLSGSKSMKLLGSSTMALLFLWMLFKKLGTTYVLSENFLQRWKSAVGRNRAARKLIAAVKPLRAHVGSMYWVKKTTIVEILQIILSMTINLFLAC